MLVLASLFEEFYICKPLTSRPTNSETYLVCTCTVRNPGTPSLQRATSTSAASHITYTSGEGWSGSKRAGVWGVYCHAFCIGPHCVSRKSAVTGVVRHARQLA